ncbi:MAG: DUF3486 family protein [Pseudomonadota bacterium]|nr:DUF3486 family protein [Pseudomonadota bacterium]
MPRRSSLLELPDDLRRDLNARLVSQGFSDYDGLVTWLDAELEKRDLEIRISRSALHRHGRQFEEKLEKLRIATEQARAISEGAEDSEGAMNDALVRLVQTKLFEILVQLDNNEDDPEISHSSLNKITLAVSRLVRASVKQKEWMMEVREKLESQKQEAAEKVDRLATTKGLPRDVAKAIRAEILGIKIDGDG